MNIMRIPQAQAAAFIEKWHYSRRCPTGKNIFFGWMDGAEMYAIADYGIGVNPYAAAYLAKVTKEKVSNSNLVELKRLCRVEPKRDDLPLTKFLAACHKELIKMGYCYIVSFSDPAHGHNGGIYKAASFSHLGQTNEERHVVDVNGVVRHRRYAFRYARRNSCTIEEARQRLGLKIVKTVRKDRWFKRIAVASAAKKLNPPHSLQQPQPKSAAMQVEMDL
jgi:hypothetical protein